MGFVRRERVAHVASWHGTDIAALSPHVRCWGVNGLAGLALTSQHPVDAVISPTTETYDPTAPREQLDEDRAFHLAWNSFISGNADLTVG
jgi:hypothetical protein